MKPKKRAEIRIESNVKDYKAAIENVRKFRLFKAGHVLRNQLLRDLAKGPRTGRRYYVPGTRELYTASAPGERPAWRTGDLARSYRLAPDRMPLLGKHIDLGSELDYATYLEFGTPNMKARPHLNPAYEAVKEEIRSILTSTDTAGQT